MSAPIITGQPATVVAALGSATNVSVAATGGDLSYQWFKDGVKLTGQTNSSVTFASFQITNIGSYSVLITNVLGLVLSRPALVSFPNAPLKAWGRNDYGQLGNGTTSDTNRPVTVGSNGVAMSGGQGHSLLVKTDGTLWSFGRNDYGQLGNGTTNHQTAPVSVASNVVAAVAGVYHSLYVKADGTLWAVGYNGNGQLGNGTTSHTNRPVSVASNVVAVAAGQFHTLFVKADGTLWAMGRNDNGQLGNGTTTATNRPVKVATNVVSVAAGHIHSLLVKTDGTLWTMGDNSYGQLGNGTTTDTNRPVQVGTNVMAVAAGLWHSLFATTDGTLWAVGYNGYGQLGNGNTNQQTSPVQVGTNVVAVAAGREHSLMVKADGGLWGMGRNDVGQLGDGTTIHQASPVEASGLTVGSLGAMMGGHHVLAVGEILVPQTITFDALPTVSVANAPFALAATASSGLPVIYTTPDTNVVSLNGNLVTLLSAGTATITASQAGNAEYVAAANVSQVLLVTNPPPPVITSQPTGMVVTSGSAANLSVMAMSLAPGTMGYQWLKDGVMLSGQTNSTLEFSSFGITHSGSYQVVISNPYGLVISLPVLVSVPDATLQAWGNNDYGQLGNGTTTDINVPLAVGSNVVAAAVGGFHSLFVKNDGTLWAMGENSSGQLGNGTTNHQASPAVVGSNVVAVAAGSFHSLFLKNDGTLWAMGRNDNGQLGNGNIASTNRPVSVGSNVVAVAAGAAHSMFVKADGTLWAMGGNSYGQLGNGNIASTNRPVSVDSNVVAVAAGSQHTLFVKNDGTLWVMGGNSSGQLGSGSGNTNRPVTVASNVVAVAAGLEHSLFVKNDGSLWGMGQNIFGQLNGTSDWSLHSSPVAVASNVVAVVAGSYHSLFVKNDGTLWAMGRNYEGQLGHSDFVPHPSPVLVSDIKVGSVGAMGLGWHNLVVGKTLPASTPVSVTLNNLSQTYDGTARSVSASTDPAGRTVVITYNGATQAPVNAGSYTVVATVTESGYTGSAINTLVIAQAAQTITVDALPISLPFDQFTNAIPVTATASSGLPVTLTLDVGSAANLSGSALSNAGSTGTVTLRANQSGNGNYLAATEVVVTIAVTKNDQSITFGSLPDRVATAAPFTLTATADSGLVVTFSVVSGPATLSGNTLTLTGAGTVTVQASQGGDGIYDAAPPVVQSFNVSLAAPQITTQPAAVVAALGSATNVSVAAAGGDLSYQWLKDGVRLVGQTNSTMEFSSFGITSSGSYQVVVTNATGLVISRPALVSFPNARLRGWGNHDFVNYNGDEQLNNSNKPVVVDTNVVAVAVGSVGSTNSFFVKADGTLWGLDDDFGHPLWALPSTNRPVSVASNVVAVAAGQGHSLFVKADGTLWAMGYNQDGRFGNGVVENYYGAPYRPPEAVASNVVVVAVGSYHSLFVKSDGTLWAMGNNDYGQLGIGTTAGSSTPVAVASNVVSVAAGRMHSLFVKSDGTLWAMGDNGIGQLNGLSDFPFHPPIQYSPAPYSPPHKFPEAVSSNVVGVAAGAYHSLFVKNDGTLWAMGWSFAGQCGYDGYASPLINVASNVAGVAAGFKHSLFVKTDGTLWSLGNDATRELRSPPESVAICISNLSVGSIGAMSVGWCSLAVAVAAPQVASLTNQTIYAGQSATFSLSMIDGDGPFTYQWQFNGVAIAGATNASYIVVSAGLTNGGAYTAIVTGLGGLSGSASATLTILATPAITGQPAGVSAAWGSTTNVFVTATGGYLSYQWFKDGVKLAGQTNSSVTFTSFQITNSGSYSVLITNVLGLVLSRPALVSFPNAPLKAWGRNEYGQLGNGTISDTNRPVTVASNGVAVTSGQGHSLFLKADGTLWSVGRNEYGQLGNLTTNAQTFPAAVASNVVAAVAGAYHCLFVENDGTLWAVGYNSNGQLGNGTTSHTNRPVAVASNVVAVAAGQFHSLFLKADATLWAMGRNDNGQLGNGTTISTNRPVKVATNVVSLAAGQIHSLLVKMDGTLWAMGDNSYGQLGNGTITDTNRPVQVASNVVAVAGGLYHSLYLKTDGMLWAMGNNGYGQLGNGNTNQQNSPLAVGSNVVAGAAGRDHSLFVKADGTLWAMGRNDQGQLGDGTTNRRTSPVSASGLTVGSLGAMAISYHSLAVGEMLVAQTITFDALPAVSVTNAPFALAATASSGLPVSYTTPDTNVVSLNGNLVTLLSAGTATITASQSGSATYAAAANVSQVLLVTNPPPPLITSQPAGLVAAAGSATNLSVTAMGDNLSYQWLKDGVRLMGQTNSTLGFSSFGITHCGSYQVVVSHPYGMTLSRAALVSLTNAPLWAWGNNFYGQLGIGTSDYLPHASPVTVVGDMAAVAAVAAGQYHSLFVKADGTLWTMGNNFYGQLGNGTSDFIVHPAPVQVNSNVTAVAVGNSHSLFVNADGMLWAMGNNNYGQLGNGNIIQQTLPVAVGSNVVTVTAGESHSLFVKSDGTLWAMGHNESGQLGNGTTTDTNRPVQVASNVVAVAAGYAHSLFVKNDGTLWAMGYNGYGQLGNGTTLSTNRPVAVASNVAAAAGGNGHSLFVKNDGSLWSMGLNLSGQLGVGTTTYQQTPVRVSGLTVGSLGTMMAASHSLVVGTARPQTITFGALPAVSVADAPFELTATSDSGLPVSLTVTYAYANMNTNVVTLNGNRVTILGLGTATITASQAGNAEYVAAANVSQVLLVTNPPPPVITSQPSGMVVTSGSAANLSVVATNPAPGTMGYQWLKDGVILSGQTNSTLSFSSFGITHCGLYAAVITNRFGVVISQPVLVSMPDASLLAWGKNVYGQLGNGNTNQQNSPVTVTSNVVTVAAGLYHSLFVKADGTLWAMGWNYYGQLGNGTTNDAYVPVAVASNVVSVVAGLTHSLFVKTDGTLWAMGYNTYGQLGNGTTTHQTSPVSVASNVVAAAAGGLHSLFVKTDGTLWAMGYNGSGPLGNGTTSHTNRPVSVASNVVVVAAGGSHSLFVKSDGTLWAMGYNSHGQLGIKSSGFTSFTNLPVRVASNVVAVAAGYSHSLFVKADGTLWAMGQNELGTFGNGNTISTDTPVTVGSNVVAVAAGSSHSHFVKADGTLWAMGNNYYGQLGDGTNTAMLSYLPVKVTGITVGSLGAMGPADHNLAVGMSLPAITPVSVTLNNLSQTYDGTAHSVSASTEPVGKTVTTTYNGATQAPVNAGSYTVVATVTESGYTGSATNTLVIAQAAQAITVDPLPISLPFDQFTNAIPVMASASSGLPVTLTLDAGSAANLSGSVLSNIGSTGTVTLRANQSGNGNYLAATELVVTMTVSKANQSITFGSLPDRVATAAPFTLSATADSGLAVTYSVVIGPATLSGNTLTLTGAGVVIVQASQGGNGTYAAATPVSQSFNVALMSQSITFGNLPDVSATNGPITLSATADSGLAVTFSVVGGPATLSGNTLTLTGAGTVTVQASQSGNGTYAAAPPVSQSFTVTLASQSITFGSLPPVCVTNAPFALTATASSGLPVSYTTTNTNVVTLTGNRVTFVNPGTATITASQSGNAYYAAATQVSQTLLVTNGPAQVYQPAQSGAWNDPATWGGQLPPQGAYFEIPAGLDVTLDLSPVTVSNITISGTLNLGTNTLNVSGNFTISGTFNPGTGTVKMTGDASQILAATAPGTLSFYNLTLDKLSAAATVTSTSHLVVSNITTLTKGKLVSASDYQDIFIGVGGELQLTQPITVGGNFTNNGTLTTDGHRITFDGGVEQHLSLASLTFFDDVTVAAGTTLIETESSDSALVMGNLVNQGVIRKQQAITEVAEYYFGLAGSYGSGLEIDVTDLAGANPLTTIQVERVDGTPSNAPAGSTATIHWRISGTGTDYQADLILPQAGVTNPVASYYTGTGTVWNAGGTALDETAVIYNNAPLFTHWAVFSMTPIPATPGTLAAAYVGGALSLSWTNSAVSLEAAPEVTGPYARVPGATSPFVLTNFSAPRQFYRLAKPVD